MKTADAIAYFGNRHRLALALGIRWHSVQEWGLRVPELRQLQLEELTRGELKAEARLHPAREPVLGG
jgi:hypothetical protein